MAFRVMEKHPKVVSGEEVSDLIHCLFVETSLHLTSHPIVPTYGIRQLRSNRVFKIDNNYDSYFGVPILVVRTSIYILNVKPLADLKIVKFILSASFMDTLKTKILRDA